MADRGEYAKGSRVRNNLRKSNKYRGERLVDSSRLPIIPGKRGRVQIMFEKSKNKKVRERRKFQSERQPGYFPRNCSLFPAQSVSCARIPPGGRRACGLRPSVIARSRRPPPVLLPCWVLYPSVKDLAVRASPRANARCPRISTGSSGIAQSWFENTCATNVSHSEWCAASRPVCVDGGIGEGEDGGTGQELFFERMSMHDGSQHHVLTRQDDRDHACNCKISRGTEQHCPHPETSVWASKNDKAERGWWQCCAGSNEYKLRSASASSVHER